MGACSRNGGERRSRNPIISLKTFRHESCSIYSLRSFQRAGDMKARGMPRPQ